MSVTEEVIFDNSGHIERYPMAKKFYLSAVIILVATLAFGLGRLSVIGGREPVRIEYNQELTTNNRQLTASVINSQTSVIASKNGKKYHYSSCPGANQIAEANKITFPTPEAAEASGYTLANNCKP